MGIHDRDWYVDPLKDWPSEKVARSSTNQKVARSEAKAVHRQTVNGVTYVSETVTNGDGTYHTLHWTDYNGAGKEVGILAFIIFVVVPIVAILITHPLQSLAVIGACSTLALVVSGLSKLAKANEKKVEAAGPWVIIGLTIFIVFTLGFVVAQGLS